MVEYKKVQLGETAKVFDISLSQRVELFFERLSSVENHGNYAILSELKAFLDFLQNADVKQSCFRETHIQYLLHLFLVVDRETVVVLSSLMNLLTRIWVEILDAFLANGLIEAIQTRIETEMFDTDEVSDMFLLLTKMWERKLETVPVDEFPLKWYLSCRYRGMALRVLIILAGHNPGEEIVHELCLDLWKNFVPDQAHANKYAWIFRNLVFSNIENLRFIIDMPDLPAEENLFRKVHSFFGSHSSEMFLKPYLQFLCIILESNVSDRMLDHVQPRVVLEIATSATLDVIEVISLRILCSIAEGHVYPSVISSDDIPLIMALIDKNCFVKSMKYLLPLLACVFREIPGDIEPFITPQLLEMLCEVIDTESVAVTHAVDIVNTVITKLQPCPESSRRVFETMAACELPQYLLKCSQDSEFCSIVCEKLTSCISKCDDGF